MNKKFALVKKAGVAVATAGSAIAASTANAAITYDTTGILADISASEAFAITCGLAFIALTATISVLRKGRGAVR